MTTEPDRKTLGSRVKLEIDVPLGDVTWQFSTKAGGQGVSVSPGGGGAGRPTGRDGLTADP
jgi:hypothetical protein